MPEIARVRSIKALGDALGVSKSTAHGYSLEPWLPARDAGGFWDVDACRRALAAHRRGETPAPASAPSSPAPSHQPATADAPLDPVAVAEKALRAAATRLDQVVAGGKPHALGAALESVKKCVEEMRRSQAAALELAKKKGDVIDLEVAIAVAAKCGRRFVDALARLEVKFAHQLELWLGDGDFRALDPLERTRRVRAWVVEQTTAARELEATEIEKLVAAESADA